MKIKYVSYAFGIAILAISGAEMAMAAPVNSNNPNTVANYLTGEHGIPGDYYLHVGADTVTRAGNSENFQQWFSGWSEESGGVYIGHHSIWKMSKDGTCKEDETMVPNASASWGDYLTAGATYCVKTTDFNY